MTPIGKKWLVIADVDGTLLGDQDGWSALKMALEANPQVLLVPNSSRPLASLAKSWEMLGNPLSFPAEVGALGTEVFMAGRDVGWSARFGGFQRGPIDTAMAAMGYQRHGAEFQTALKASYAVPRAKWSEASAVLKSSGPAEIITSGLSDFDVVPQGAGKAAPVQFLAEQLQVSPAHIVAAGDSMNDLAMLEAATHGIVVANAESGLIDSTRGNLFHSDAGYARGVLSGLRALGALP